MRGGYGGSGHGSLRDRIHGSQSLSGPDSGPPSGPAPSGPPPAPGPGSPARHCLVDGLPALLVEWRRGPAGWEGRVVSVRWLDDDGWATVEQWLPASRIAPGH